MKSVTLNWVDGKNCSSNNLKPKISTLQVPNQNTEAALCIPLQAHTQATLDWSEEIAKAQKAKDSGLAIVWDIKLGLFDHLQQAISSRSQLLSLQLALDQFSEKIAPQFSDSTLGVFIYRNSLRFADALSWDKTMEINFKDWHARHFANENCLQLDTAIADAFCCNVATDYFHLLIPHLPENGQTYLLFEATEKQTLLEEAYLLNHERYGILHPLVTNSKHKNLCDDATVGVCLPLVEECLPYHHLSLQTVFEELNQANIAYRIIPEEQLTAKWDGLDEIIVEKKAMSFQTKRKLQGFAAAGGKTVTLGSSYIGLPEEELFDTWQKATILKA